MDSSDSLTGSQDHVKHKHYKLFKTFEGVKVNRQVTRPLLAYTVVARLQDTITSYVTQKLLKCVEYEPEPDPVFVLLNPHMKHCAYAQKLSATERAGSR